MAVVYPLANGNWSTLANWYSGGIPYGQLPLAGDDVHANGKTIAIDVATVTVVSLKTAASAPAIAGGVFTCAIACTITANIDARNGTTTVFNTSNLSGTTITIIGNLWGGANTNAITHLQTGTINITGTANGGTAAAASAAIATSNSSAIINHTGNITASTSCQAVRINCTYNLIGNITGGITNGAPSFFTISPCVLNVNGNVLVGATGAPAIDVVAGSTVNISSQQTVAGVGNITAIVNAGTVVVNNNILGALAVSPSTGYFVNNTNIFTVNGNVTMQNYTAGTTVGILNNTGASGVITVNGNIIGGTVANTIAVSNGSTGTINVTGNITGGSNATNTPAIYSTTAGTIDITGSCSADAYPALFSSSITAVNRLRGNVLTKNGIVAYYSFKINISPSAAQTFTFQDTSNVNRLIATSNISPGAPGISDVRFGTVYGSSSEYTGTLRVPNPNTVSLGVLTDNTTGTLIMTPADFWGVASSGLTTAGSIGERLKVASTVQSTGDQLASYIV